MEDNDKSVEHISTASTDVGNDSTEPVAVESTSVDNVSIETAPIVSTSAEQAMPIERVVPPTGYLSQMYLNHFGVILSNVAIASTILSFVLFLFSLVSALLVPVYYVLLIFISVITLGTIYGFAPNFYKLWYKGSDIIDFITSDGFKYVVDSIPYLIGISIGGSIIAMILLFFDKKNRNWVRIGICIATIVFAIVALILLIIGVRAS